MPLGKCYISMVSKTLFSAFSSVFLLELQIGYFYYYKPKLLTQHVRFMKLEVNFGNANMSVITAEPALFVHSDQSTSSHFVIRYQQFVSQN